MTATCMSKTDGASLAEVAGAPGTGAEGTVMQRFQVALLLHGSPLEPTVRHVFTPGLYARTSFEKAGVEALSVIHRTEHPFVISQGSAEVYEERDGELVHAVTLTAPFMGITKPGTQRAIRILEDCVCTTFHVMTPADFECVPAEGTPEEKHAALVAGMEARLYAPWENPLLTPALMGQVEQLNACRAAAAALVAERRAAAPEGCDPQNSGLITGIVSVVLSVTGSVMQYNASKAAARANDRMATLNFLAQEQNAQQAIQTAQLQYEANQKLAQQQRESQLANAKALEDEARAAEAQGRLEVDNQREANARAAAAARAKFAHAGVDEAGTPVAYFEEMDQMGALALQQIHWQTTGKSSNLLFEAQLAKNDAAMTDFNASVQGFKDKSAEVAAQNAITGAALERLGALNKGQQMRAAGSAALVSGIGSAFGEISSLGQKYYKPKNTGTGSGGAAGTTGNV